MFGFKRKRAQEEAPVVVALDSSEVAYAGSWGFSMAQWFSLSPEERRDYRDRVSFAPNVAGVSK